jgi:glycine cleavage system regulatory protein
MHEVYGNIGFSIPGALVSLPGNFDANLGFSSSTGYNWTQSSGEMWTEETTITVSLSVPPRIITRLYQTLGKCNFYTVRANKLKRVDTDSRTLAQTVTYIYV